MPQPLFVHFAALVFWGCLLCTSGCNRTSSSTEALGTLERERIILKATANEIIITEPVAEGTMVKQGTVLVQLDDRRQQANVAKARANVEQSRAMLEQLHNGARREDVAAATARLMGARSTQQQASRTHERTVRLVEQKLASQATLDQALAEHDSAEAALKSTSEELLALTNGTRQEELDRGKAAHQSALAQLALELLALSELSIVATRDAYLDSLPWNVGERVQIGSPVAVLLANSSPFARVYIPEPWRTRIHVGDTLSVHVDGVDHPFEGQLRWVSNDAAFTPYFALNAEDRSRLVYLAEVDLVAAEQLPTGIPVQVVLAND